MSDLNSDFNVEYGWPNGSALEHSLSPLEGEVQEAGTIVTLSTDQLLSAAVLRMVTDADQSGADPTLAAGDAGKAYVVNNWATQTDGDIVEWDGAAFNIVVVNDTGVPPDGTRVVVAEASAGGSFAGAEEQVWAYSGGWAAATAAPGDGEKIDISGANSIYYNKRFQYEGTHPTGAWVEYAATRGIVRAMFAKATSLAVAEVKLSMWVINEGNKANIETDGEFTNNLAALKIASGVVFKAKTAVANTLAPGDYVEADAGLIVKCDGTNHAIGQVQWSNGVTGAGGVVIVTGCSGI
jgi:hypothetical protein